MLRTKEQHFESIVCRQESTAIINALKNLELVHFN